MAQISKTKAWEEKVKAWNEDLKNIALTSGAAGFIGAGLLVASHYLDIGNNFATVISQYLGAGGLLTAGITILTAFGLNLYSEYKEDFDKLLGVEPNIKRANNGNLKYLIKDTRGGELNFYLMDEKNKNDLVASLSPREKLLMIEIHQDNIYIKKMRNNKYHNDEGPAFLEIYNEKTIDNPHMLDIVNELYFIDGKHVRKLDYKSNAELEISNGEHGLSNKETTHSNTKYKI